MSRKLILFGAVFLISCVQVYGQDDPNLVGYWNFDDGTAADLSGNANDGVFIGNAGLNSDPNWTFGRTGVSLDLNYQNRNTDWVEIPASDSLNITHELTILAWIRPDDIENNDGIVTKGTTRASWSLRFNITNGLRFTANAGFNLDDPTDPNFAPGAIGTGDRQSVFEVSEANEPAGIDWSFVGIVSDTQSLRFILNLEEEVLPASYIFAESNEPLTIGCYLPDDDYFNGLIDEVRIYDRALSRREVIGLSGLAEKPFEPEPVDGASGVTSGTLTWGSIEGVDMLYLGTDPNALTPVSEDVAGTYTIEEIVTGRQYFWRVDVATPDGVVTGDVWSFTVAEDKAGSPNPSDGAEFVGVDGLSLSWLPAFGATAYEVYFGTNPDALELLGQASDTSYEDAGQTLLSETFHYWRVDAVKGVELVPGPVWSFKTMPIFAVEPDLAAWYKFELGEGTLAVDWTRKGNDGVLVGDTAWTDEGYAGRALQFDGAADYVEIPRVVQDDWSIMLWLRTDNLQQSWPGRLGTVGRARNGVGLVDGDAGGPAENFVLSLNGDQITANCMADGQGDGDALVSNVRITSTDWHHVAWTRNAATGDMALFIDGVPDNSGQNDKWIGTKDAQDFIWIGGLQFGNRQQYLEGRLDEVKFFTRVLDEAEIRQEMRPDKRQPFSPEPVPGSVLHREVPVILAWTPGEGATAHNVYLGISEEGLQLVGAEQAATQYDAGLLQPGTWNWQIGEVQADGAEVKGELWNFIVPEYLIVDGFEDYNDYPPYEIYSTWLDGYENPANGSQVGYLTPPSVETTIVHGGAQSMPLLYSNVGGPTYSEATRTFSVPQDWTKYGIQTLGLWFHGTAGNTGQLYVKINGTKILYDGQADNIARAGWQPWNVDLTASGLNLQSVTSLTIGIDGNGASGTLYFDDIRLYASERQFITPVDPGTAGLQAHFEFEGTYNDSSGNARHGTAQGAPTFVAGRVGQAVNLRGLNDYVQITGYKGISGANAFSIGAWLKTTYMGDAPQEIVYFGTDAGGQRCEFRVHTDGHIRMGNGAGQVESISAVADGGWHHVAVTITENATNSSSDVQIYTDGQKDTQESTDPDAFNIVADWDVTIGYRPAQQDRFFNGQIDDVRIYDRVLSQEETAWLAGRTQPFDKPF